MRLMPLPPSERTHRGRWRGALLRRCSPAWTTCLRCPQAAAARALRTTRMLRTINSVQLLSKPDMSSSLVSLLIHAGASAAQEQSNAVLSNAHSAVYQRLHIAMIQRAKGCSVSMASQACLMFELSDTGLTVMCQAHTLSFGTLPRALNGLFL